ncbi:predicted protein [Plenodomus lingam JN3]|uniref:Predicted protein n=1 Tax=Leptosphaeria maculans (strain JN3 / isolate v23.1.3 / race Av1-4-5-6-7-8) TaxID=985895 RepID=E5ADU8_LEPMJ|nr:predicted protein [Plenodomus lingam JN3]CBY01387.1 predicted protein [Plenodomus lingam JN3]
MLETDAKPSSKSTSKSTVFACAAMYPHRSRPPSTVELPMQTGEKPQPWPVRSWPVAALRGKFLSLAPRITDDCAAQRAWGYWQAWSPPAIPSRPRHPPTTGAGPCSLFNHTKSQESVLAVHFPKAQGVGMGMGFPGI